MSYKHEEIVIVNEIAYMYDDFNEKLRILDDLNQQTKSYVLCPICLNDSFTITYGFYKCIANCKCGHSMTVYDG